jgi:hypothetical protein
MLNTLQSQKLGGLEDRIFNWGGTDPLASPAALPLNMCIRRKVMEALASREKYGV